MSYSRITLAASRSVGVSAYSKSMPKPSRKPMRFAVGDRVEVLPVMLTRFVGRRGVIECLTESKQAITLDKYYVRIDGEAEERMFWDIELKLTPL
jgi:hypothetical protein